MPLIWVSRFLSKRLGCNHEIKLCIGTPNTIGEKAGNKGIKRVTQMGNYVICALEFD